MARLSAIWGRFINPGAGKFWLRALMGLCGAAGAWFVILPLGFFLSLYVWGLCGDAYPTTCWSDPWYAYIPFAVGLLILVVLGVSVVLSVLYALIMVVYAGRQVVRRIQAPTPPGTMN
jgi:hypothetical protein